jgi:uncharacterized protein (DUF433 family)
MWHVLESWQFTQLKRLASFDPDRVETTMNTVWNAYPGLFEEVCVSAVDQEQLTVARCAEILSLSEEKVEELLATFRSRPPQPAAAVVRDERAVARLAEGHVAVWEIVREYRKLGNVERLVDSFTSLSRGELAAALKYAEQNPGEIESQISRYEELLSKRRSEYPFAR